MIEMVVLARDFAGMFCCWMLRKCGILPQIAPEIDPVFTLKQVSKLLQKMPTFLFQICPKPTLESASSKRAGIAVHTAKIFTCNKEIFLVKWVCRA